MEGLRRFKRNHIVPKSTAPPTRREREREAEKLVCTRWTTAFWHSLDVRLVPVGWRKSMNLALYANYTYQRWIILLKGREKGVPSVVHPFNACMAVKIFDVWFYIPPFGPVQWRCSAHLYGHVQPQTNIFHCVWFVLYLAPEDVPRLSLYALS